MLRTHLVRFYNWRALCKLARYAQREGVTAIYSNTSITILGAELAKRLHVRHIWHWHEPVDERFGWHFTMVEYYQRLVQATDTIVCISQQQKQQWSKELDLPLTNAQVVYNPIKKIAFTPEARAFSAAKPPILCPNRNSLSGSTRHSSACSRMY